VNGLDIPQRINGLSLFSGIGGIDLALSPWVRPVAYCENERYAQGVLLSRMRSGQLPTAPIWDDVRTLRGESLGNWVDIIYGGFPCQDLSVAGNGAGLAGERSGLVFEVFRLARECRPRFIFLENVPALAVRGLDRVLLELDALGYDARWTIVSAAEVGAPHLRERIWILAHAKRERLRDESDGVTEREGATESRDDGEEKPVADSERGDLGMLQSREQSGLFEWDRESKGTRGEQTSSSIRLCEIRRAARERAEWWSTEPDVGRVVDGVPRRVDRVKCLGNAVVPQAAREAFVRLSGIGGVR
jgi:DNA (cytosine-5)-methyltransferase 1